jgi:hypothetical protein
LRISRTWSTSAGGAGGSITSGAHSRRYKQANTSTRITKLITMQFLGFNSPGFHADGVHLGARMRSA